MTSDTHFFTVWTNGSAESIFGAASLACASGIGPASREPTFAFGAALATALIWWCRHVGLNYGPRHYQ
jgi:hypothetical protein